MARDEILRPMAVAVASAISYCNPHSASVTSHATFDEIVHVQLASDLLHWLADCAITHDRCPRNNAHLSTQEPRDRVDQLFRESVGEVLLFRIVGKVSQGQD